MHPLFVTNCTNLSEDITLTELTPIIFSSSRLRALINVSSFSPFSFHFPSGTFIPLIWYIIPLSVNIRILSVVLDLTKNLNSSPSLYSISEGSAFALM